MKELNNTPVNIFDSNLYEAHGDVKKASFQAPKAYWDMLVRTGYANEGEKECRYCKCEDIGKYFRIEGVTPIQTALPSQEELMTQLAAMKEELNALKNKPEENAAPAAIEKDATPSSDEGEEVIDLNAMNEEELRALAAKHNVKLGNTKDVEKIRDKIELALS